MMTQYHHKLTIWCQTQASEGRRCPRRPRRRTSRKFPKIDVLGRPRPRSCSDRLDLVNVPRLELKAETLSLEGTFTIINWVRHRLLRT